MRRSSASLDRLRAICAALPETEEKVFGGHTTPTWRVRDKIFAMSPGEDEAGGRVSVWCKAPPGAQDVLIAGDPDRFYRPRYVGAKGWVGVYLDGDAPWDVIADLVRDSYRIIAPKRLAQALDDATAAADSAPPAKKAAARTTAMRKGAKR